MMGDSAKGKREGRRVLLDNVALDAIKVISQKLKVSHCKVTHSQLVSYIVDCFFRKYLIREQKHLEDTFFDKKAYLKSLLTGNSTEEELAESVRLLLKKPSRGLRNEKKKIE